MAYLLRFVNLCCLRPLIHREHMSGQLGVDEFKPAAPIHREA